MIAHTAQVLLPPHAPLATLVTPGGIDQLGRLACGQCRNFMGSLSAVFLDGLQQHGTRFTASSPA